MISDCPGRNAFLLNVTSSTFFWEIKAPPERNPNMKPHQLLVMCLMISLFCSPLANVYCSAQDKGQMMVKRDLAESGFSIILPSESSFDAELMKLGLNNSTETKELKPFSVILKNSSTRSIVAFALRWTAADATGNVTTHDRSYIQPSGLLDGGRARRERTEIEHQIRQGASRFITIEGMVRSSGELHALASRFMTSPPQFSVTSVLLDAAIFDDGEAIGPDQLGMVDRFKAHFTAEQDLVVEVDSRLARGEIMTDIFADIRSKLPLEPAEIPITPLEIYDQIRRQLLSELETTERNFGDNVAKRTILLHKYDKRPDIHKKPEN